MNAQTGEQTFGTECRQGFGTGEDRQGHERERQQEVRHFRMFRGWLQRRASRLAPLWRSEEHTSELQSLMRISYAVFCLKKKKNSRHYVEKDTSNVVTTL